MTDLDLKKLRELAEELRALQAIYDVKHAVLDEAPNAILALLDRLDKLEAESPGERRARLVAETVKATALGSHDVVRMVDHFEEVEQIKAERDRYAAAIHEALQLIAGNNATGRVHIADIRKARKILEGADDV